MKTNNISAKKIWFDDTRIFVELNDGRVIGNPLEWFPRLQNASKEQRENFEFSANGYGIHWPELDEDLSADGFLTYSPQHILR